MVQVNIGNVNNKKIQCSNLFVTMALFDVSIEKLNQRRKCIPH